MENAGNKQRISLSTRFPRFSYFYIRERDYVNAIERLVAAGMDRDNAAEICAWFVSYSSDELLEVYVQLYETRKERTCF